MTITIGSTVRHRTYANRGAGKVLNIQHPYLPGRPPKLQVAFERGPRCWCFYDDLTVEAPVMAPGAKPTLKVVEHAPVVA